MSYLEEAKAIYHQQIPDNARKVQGCLDSEITALEHEFSVKLPAAYREFLSWMGHNGGGFKSGSDCFYPDLKQINLWAHNLIDKSISKLRLPDDAFIFHWDPTRCFDFFLISEGDDPPVYFYMDPALEGYIREAFRPEEIPLDESYLSYIFDNHERNKFIVRSPSFSQCLMTDIRGYSRTMNRIRKG